MYFNGKEIGFKIFQQIVERLNAGFDRLVWLKLGEIARYWAARELTTIARPGTGGVAFRAPFACPFFTVEIHAGGEAEAPATRLRLSAGSNQTVLEPAHSMLELKPGTFVRERGKLVACFDLPKGSSRLEMEVG